MPFVFFAGCCVGELSLSVELALFEIAFVNTSIGEDTFAVARYFTANEVTFVVTVAAEHEAAFTVFFAFFPVSDVSEVWIWVFVDGSTVFCGRVPEVAARAVPRQLRHNVRYGPIGVLNTSGREGEGEDVCGRGCLCGDVGVRVIGFWDF